MLFIVFFKDLKLKNFSLYKNIALLSIKCFIIVFYSFLLAINIAQNDASHSSWKTCSTKKSTASKDFYVEYTGVMLCNVPLLEKLLRFA